MRDLLVGYLLNAVEPEERAQLERRLAEDESLRRDLETLRSCVHPLACDQGHHEPPPGLAQRCCDYVYSRISVMPAALSSSGSAGASRHQWSWLDIGVAGAIAAAVAVLLVPAVYQSRVHSQTLACKKNLKDIGAALASYSERHDGYFPVAAQEGRLAAAGTWAPTLVSEGHLPESRTVVCPSTALADEADFRVPTIAQLEAMKEKHLAEMLPRMAGSYGYTLGYRDESNRLKPQKNRNRACFALVSDVPGEGPGNSPNHGGDGQNVLFEDQHVKYLKSRCPDTKDDDIFRNAKGRIAPGLHPDDSVIVPSHLKPE